jgi:hypothetical protein
MSFRFILLSLCCALFSPAQGALDLTPSTKEYTEDGATYRLVNLKNGEGTVTFAPPEGWMIRGHQARLQLNPPKNDFSEAVVEASPLPAPQALDEAAINAFKEQVRATLPAGSHAITTLLEASNTVMPAGKPSFEVMISYQLWGKTFYRSALLVNAPQDRLVFRFTSLKEDFNALNSSFRRSVATWQWIEPAPAAPRKDSAVATK